VFHAQTRDPIMVIVLLPVRKLSKMGYGTGAEPAEQSRHDQARKSGEKNP
jgi:hypothetical protein